MKTCQTCGKTIINKQCTTCEYRSLISHSQTPKAIDHRRAAFARVLKRHGVKWEEA